MAVVLPQFLRKSLGLVDVASDTDPLSVVQSGWISLPVYPKGAVVVSFDQVISTLVAVMAPRLDGQGLVEVVGSAFLVVASVDQGLDGVGVSQGPNNQGLE